MDPLVVDEDSRKRQQQEDELARLVKEGVQPNGFQQRMKLVGDKLVGNVPMGVDASNKTMRKVIGGGYELLAVFKFGVFGGLLALFGILFIWVAFQKGFDYQEAGAGSVMLGLGLWALKYAREAWRNFRIMRKA